MKFNKNVITSAIVKTFAFLKYVLLFIVYKRARNCVIVFGLVWFGRGGGKSTERNQVEISNVFGKLETYVNQNVSGII